MAWYQVDLTLGAHSWTIQNGVTDPEVLDGLTLGWSLPQGDLQPWQPDPMTATTGLLVADIATVTDLDIGSPVTIEVTIDPATGAAPAFTFYGRVTDLAATPHPSGGMVLSVIAVDHTVGGPTVGEVDWPTENVNARVVRMFAGTGYNPPTVFYGFALLLGHQAAAAVTLPQALTQLADGLVADVGGTLGRPIVTPRISGGVPDATDPYLLEWLPSEAYEPLPAEFGATDDGYGLLAGVNPAQVVLDSFFVRRSAQWVRRKFGAINRLIVSADGIDYPFSTGAQPEVTATVTTTVTTPGYPATMAAYYMPEGGSTNRWQVETLSYLLSKNIDGGLDPATLDAARWMPRHADTAGASSRVLAYLSPVLVTNLPRQQNPGASDIYAGQLQDAELVIAGGEMQINFSLRRTLPNAAPAVAALTPAGLAASTYNAVRIDQLDPDFTVYDYRLADQA